MVQILIPTSKQKQSKNGRQQYTVYCIELYLSGKCHKIDKRYSEFYELHRTLKKYFHQLPNLPPKKVLRNSSQKLIEQRRTSLEEYLKSLLKSIGLDNAKELKEFLNLNVSSNESSTTNLNKKSDGEQQHKFLFRSTASKDQQEEDNYRNFNFHQCMIGFKNDNLFSLDYDLPNYLINSPGSLHSDSNKSNNYETNSCTSSASTSLSSSQESGYCDIVVMGSLNALYDKSLKKF